MRKLLILTAAIASIGSFPFIALAFTDVGASTALDGVQTNDGTLISFGNASGASVGELSFGYLPAASHNICTFTANIGAQGSPTDALILELRIGTTSVSSTRLYDQGTFVQQASSHIQVRSSTISPVTWTFSPCAVVVGANWYQFIIYRDGTPSNTNKYNVYLGTAYPTLYGTGKWGFNWYNLSGTVQKFNLSTPFDVALNGTENFGVSSPSTTPQFADSIVNRILGINDTNAPTSTSEGIASFSNIPSYFASRIPIGYVYDIYNIWNNVSTSTSEFGALSIDFNSSSASTGTRAWLPDNIVFFSTTTVTSYIDDSLLDLLNALASGVIAVTWGMYVFRSATTVIKPV